MSDAAPFPSRRDCLQIAAVSGLDPRTIAACLRGTKKAQPATRAVLRQALVTLQLPDPWPANDQHGGAA